MVGNQHMEITEEVIVEATDLELEGLNFYRERNLFDRVVDDFVDSEMEKAHLVKIGVELKMLTMRWKVVPRRRVMTLTPRTRLMGMRFMWLKELATGLRKKGEPWVTLTLIRRVILWRIC